MVVSTIAGPPPLPSAPPQEGRSSSQPGDQSSLWAAILEFHISRTMILLFSFEFAQLFKFLGSFLVF